ncbi:nicotinate (nicotinamide) nucleotide adenylyltransferase [Psychrobacter sp.]|uniref:nicotinate (nicotinamide) nucleotide adenylyltransferase n=1 Tax=Psychrobacter sp. TaxID=56811 RepID=UPI0025ECB708|nr:nicotinate (nicotinamide) nucleotide adenylyltransferase [Psychrobacter sp.]
MPNKQISSKPASDLRAIKIYLGGSFDPVHKSHLALLAHVYSKLATYSEKVEGYFLPTSRSPLKSESSEAEHRLNMLAEAIKDMRNTELPTPFKSNFGDTIGISDHEIWQSPPTYTINTLTELRSQYPNYSLVFIVGADNIANLSKWRDGDKLTQFAHLWVFPRDTMQSQTEILALLPESLKSQVTFNVQDLKINTHGHIYIDSQTVAPLSSTQIRQAIKEGKPNIAKSALPHSVYSYIMKNNLYHSY